MRPLLLALIVTVTGCATLEGADVARPLFLYENVLEDATLTASSTATGYDVDALKTRVTADRWTSQAGTTHTITAQLASAINPTAWALTKQDLTLEASPAYDSEDFSTSENPLATGWTDVGDEALKATSGYATDAGMPALVASSTVRHYVRSGGDAFIGYGQGYVQAEIQFSSVSSPSNMPGVSVRDSATGAYIAAGLLNTGQTYIWFYGAGGSLITGYSQAISALSPATDYTFKLVVDDTNAYVYLDGVLKQTQGWTGDMPAGFDPDQQGIWQYQSTPASNTAQWDDFAAGLPTTDPAALVAPVILRGGNDGATWPYQKLFEIDSNATFIGTIDDASSYSYWQWEFPQSASRAVMLGCLALGRRLDLTESMAQGFDPTSLRLMQHQNRSNSGEFLGQVVRYPTQQLRLRFGPAGLSTVDFFDQTGTPSWRDFLESTWSIGRAFWFAWDITQRPDDMWFCMVPRKARTGAPFITAIRRDWRFDFEALVERVGT